MRALIATGLSVAGGVTVFADGLTGFKTLGDISPFAFKSDYAALSEDLNNLRWDEAADRADRWQQELAQMSDQATMLMDRERRTPDPMISRMIADLTQRIITKQAKYSRLLCDLERRNNPNRAPC